MLQRRFASFGRAGWFWDKGGYSIFAHSRKASSLAARLRQPAPPSMARLGCRSRENTIASLVPVHCLYVLHVVVFLAQNLIILLLACLAMEGWPSGLRRRS